MRIIRRILSARTKAAIQIANIRDFDVDRVHVLFESQFFLGVNALTAVTNEGDYANDKEGGQGVKSKNLGANEDGGQERVGCPAKDGGVTEGCSKRQGNAHHGGYPSAECGSDGEQRRDFAALEPDGNRCNRECKFQNPVAGKNRRANGGSICKAIINQVRAQARVAALVPRPA